MYRKSNKKKIQSETNYSVPDVITIHYTEIVGANMAITKMRRFRAETLSMTIEADHFDWGEPDHQGRQQISFFMEGSLIEAVPLEEVCSICEIRFSEIMRMKFETNKTEISDPLMNYANDFGNLLPAYHS